MEKRDLAFADEVSGQFAQDLEFKLSAAHGAKKNCKTCQGKGWIELSLPFRLQKCFCHFRKRSCGSNL